ncbi:MAG: DUF4358 domain-containing protein [Clostridia bacterium]|nr:DUF4358 domain-containing protein [Clostridia bacterium]
MKRLLSGLLAFLLILSLSACADDSTGVTPNMETVFASMADQLPEALPFDAESVFNAYGVEPAACKQEIVISYYDGNCTAELWLIEAVDQEKAESIKALAEARLESMGSQFRTYDAAAYALVGEAKLFTHGNCVVMIVSENADALLDIYQTAAELA